MPLVGRLSEVKGTPAQVLSHWMAVLERAGCEVERVGNGRLEVAMPAPGSGALPGIGGDLMSDRLIIVAGEAGETGGTGEVRAVFRFIYFTPLQLFIHFAVAAIFALHACLGGAGEAIPPTQLATAFGLAQLAAFAVAVTSLRVGLARHLAAR